LSITACAAGPRKSRRTIGTALYHSVSGERAFVTDTLERPDRAYQPITS
jgi:hypothetical protein